jgi:branched-chain amino acid transport system permease protein
MQNYNWQNMFYKLQYGCNFITQVIGHRVDKLAYFAQIVTNGLHNGGLYALLAYGYVLTYSVTHRANIAHGAVFAFAGQMLVLTATLGYTVLWMTLPAAIFSGMVAAVILSIAVLIVLARKIFPAFIEQSPNMMIVATLAVSIILMEGARISADTRDYWLPPLLSWQVHLAMVAGSPSLTLLQWINMAIIVSVIAATQLFLVRTAAGRSLRAVSNDAQAAALIGVNVKRVVTSAIIGGGMFASLAGILAVLYFGNMSFGSGLVFGLKILFITSAGGFSSPLRAAAGAFLFGEAEAIWDGYLPIVWREPIFYSALALLLCLRTENRVRIHT